MSLHPFLDSFILYLKNESNDLSFLSDSFIALRDKEKNLLSSKDLFIRHFENLKKLGLTDFSMESEDSHYLVYFKAKETPYILKVKLDSENKVSAVVEEIYRKDQKNTVLILEYDGANYLGMQKQTNKNTIQDVLENALYLMLSKKVLCFEASRTDRGVHAKGQVVHFDSSGIPPYKYKLALNKYLPEDIRVKDAYERSQLFHARYDVVKKEYQYIIDMGEYSVFDKDYVYYQKINNLPRMREELSSIKGTHDFYSFCKGEKEDTIRTIYTASLHLSGTKVIFTFVGSGFLHNMIRLIIGSLIEIDKTGLGSIKNIMEKKDKNLTNKIAPASGLYLVKIDY